MAKVGIYFELGEENVIEHFLLGSIVDFNFYGLVYNLSEELQYVVKGYYLPTVTTKNGRDIEQEEIEEMFELATEGDFIETCFSIFDKYNITVCDKTKNYIYNGKDEDKIITSGFGGYDIPISTKFKKYKTLPEFNKDNRLNYEICLADSDQSLDFEDMD